MTAHIFPQKRKRHPTSELSNDPIKRYDNLVVPPKGKAEITTMGKLQDNIHNPIPNHTPSDRRSENSGDFRQENISVPCDLIHPAEPSPSPRDENFVFVTNYSQSESTPSEPVAGQRADCRGRGYQFSSRIFLMGDGFPDPLLIAASFAYLEFSYRTILQWRIRFACRLIAGAKTGTIFVKKLETPATKYRGLNTVTALL